ncbi:class I SAM-dependent methyltransferase [Shimia thalassica]|uniref:class I SAM-dependent methyltransferase n=1 Tax=Shimia thalassica TaxID=1715693 RepID=UPI00273409D1|nr:class I SAM-dependent methyltransferase [Shimia thalassica]MDP2494627.1 class I SAM-dependent methyltransferase [Shimia thalassica]
MSDHETIAVYNAQAAEYAAMTESDARDKQLAAFIKALPAGGTVLDLGCGPGHCTEEMARHGLNATAMDMSAEMVALAAARPGVKAQLGAFADLQDEAIYDGIWANFSLLHAPRTDMPLHLDAISKALKPNGMFHIGLKTGTGEARDRLGRFYTYYEENELLDLLRSAGLTPTKINRGRGTGLEGSVSDWITVAAHG